MRILADLHHGDLYYSLQLLFEKRLSGQLYRPIGMEWYTEGYWNIYPDPRTAQQYLALDQSINIPKDIFGNYLKPHHLLNANYTFEDGIYYVEDPTKDKVQRAITLDKFKEIKFDIIISSIPQHIGPFNKLISLYQPQAKHIFQVGNSWGHQPGVKNILASCAPFSAPRDVNVCFYHQEFDLDTYKYTLPDSSNVKKIRSYIQLMQDLNVLANYKQKLSEYQFKTYGAGMDDNVSKSCDLSLLMATSGWTWHVKPGGDGYGHILHNTYACGRPTIINSNYYNGKLGSQLLIDKITCIDISKHPIQEASNLIRHYSQPDEHQKMCENSYKRFKEVVDFNEEEQRIRTFLSVLR